MHALRTALVCLLALTLSCGGASAEVGSIGVVLARKGTGEVFVRDVPNPAVTELRPNDELLFVGGTSIATFDEASLRQALRGPPGSTVDLTIAREGAIKRIRAVREVVGSPATAAAP